MEYIHYGHKHFEVNEFEPISNRELFPKPFGGFCKVQEISLSRKKMKS